MPGVDEAYDDRHPGGSTHRATTAVVVAATTLLPNGPFTGCLASKSVTGTTATKGQIYNVAVKDTTPLAACNKGDVIVTFSNARDCEAIRASKATRAIWASRASRARPVAFRRSPEP